MWWYHHQNVAAMVLLLVFSVSGQNDWQNQQFGNNRDDCCEEYCYGRDEEPFIYFGTKTAYDSLNRRSSSQHVIPGCNPVQFWSLVRHGTRLPNAEKIETLRGLTKLHQEVLRNYGERKSYPDRGRLCQEDYNLIVRWHWNDTVAPDRANSLTRQGVEDLKLLARRYKSKYPQIFQGPYDERAYSFQYDNVDRTQETYQAYIEGLFGSEAYRVHANILNDERLTKPDANCPNLMNRENQGPGYRSEYESFLMNPEYLKTANDVFRRLGFRYNMNASIMNDIYDLCRYEKAWNVQHRSPWCIAFTKTQLKLLEYGEDLKYFYKSGYGNQMSEKIGCSPVKDFYEKFEKTVNGDTSGSKATVFFTKASTLLNVLTAMGIGRDYAPLPTERTRRNWKTSELSPFGANLAAVLYQCTGNDYKVMFFLNEVPVELPECSVGLCSWSIVEQKYQGMVKNCNVDDICNKNSGHNFYVNYILYTFLAAAVSFLRV